MIINKFKTNIGSYGGGDIFTYGGFPFIYYSKEDYFEIIVWDIASSQLEVLKTKFEWVSEETVDAPPTIE